MLLTLILLSLNLLLVQGAAFGRNLCSSSSDQGLTAERLDIQIAREYMVTLINRDRASMGLPPVELDPIATAAGQEHCDEMAVAKYLSHWDLQGRKPDQRYSEAGGQGAVMENALVTQGFSQHEKYRLDPDQVFAKSDIEKMESLFFNEQPPYDGHRKNILNPHHNKVGIGLTATLPGKRITCTQEFVNQYGTVSKLPVRQIRGGHLSVKGEFPRGMSIYSVELYRDAPPQPMTPAQLKLTYSYGIPTENVARYYPPPYLSPARMNVIETQEGEKFSLDVKAASSWKPGLYYVLVWVKKADSDMPLVTSTQTVAIN